MTDRATFQVIISPLEGYPGIASKALSAELRDLFQSVILLHHHPRALIQLSIQSISTPSSTSLTIPISLEGSRHETTDEAKYRTPQLLGPDRPFHASEVATSINASMLALLDANIPIRSTVIATSCAFLDPKDVDDQRNMDSYMADDDLPCLVIYPSPREENAAYSSLVAAFSFTGHDPTEPSKSQVHGQIVFLSSIGQMTAHQRSLAINATKTASISVLDHVRTVLIERFE